MRVPLVGDSAVGKSFLIQTLATGSANHDDFDTSSPVPINDGKFFLVDTNGQEDHDRLRGAAYSNADAFVLVFSIISPTSYNNIITKWQGEIARSNPQGKPIILLGTKSDLRNDADALQRLADRHLAPVTFDQGSRLAKEIGAAAYLECSSTSLDGLNKLVKTINSLSNASKPSKAKKKAKKTKSSKESCTLI